MSWVEIHYKLSKLSKRHHIFFLTLDHTHHPADRAQLSGDRILLSKPLKTKYHTASSPLHLGVIDNGSFDNICDDVHTS